MKTAPASVPEIIEHLNPVTEQFGPVTQSDALQDVSDIIHELLTKDEQRICDKATD